MLSYVNLTAHEKGRGNAYKTLKIQVNAGDARCKVYLQLPLEYPDSQTNVQLITPCRFSALCERFKWVSFLPCELYKAVYRANRLALSVSSDAPKRTYRDFEVSATSVSACATLCGTKPARYCGRTPAKRRNEKNTIFSFPAAGGQTASNNITSFLRQGKNSQYAIPNPSLL